MEKPKKQFKSQSVNDLFRQQAASKAANSSNPNVTKLERSKSPGSATKLRLLKKTKSSNTITLSKLKKTGSSGVSSGSSKSTPEAESSVSPPSPTHETILKDDVKTAKEDQLAIDPIQKLPETIGNLINGNNNAHSETSNQNENSVNSSSSTVNIPSRSRFKFEEMTDTNNTTNVNNVDLWNDLQRNLENSQKNDSNTNTNNRNSQNDDSPWLSNPKISSFRKSIGSSLNQSPLTRPIDVSLNSPFFNDLNQPSFSTRQKSEIFTSRATFKTTDSPLPENQGITSNNVEKSWRSPNGSSIWNHEERQLSTKSDSVLNWSPFDIDSLSLDGPSLRHQHSFDAGSRSRFFPSGLDEPQSFQSFPTPPQNKIHSHQTIATRAMDNPLNRVLPENHQLSPQSSQFHAHQPLPHSQRQNSYPFIPQNAPAPPTFPQTPIQAPTAHASRSGQPSFFQPQYNETTTDRMPELIVSSAKTEKELFPSNFEILNNKIPVSLPSCTTSSPQNPQKHSSRPFLDYELPHYPEGFSSTFYKRGINNFMFIRELQPKIITSKYSDNVEVRLTFPVWDEEYRMKSSRVDIEVKELDGKLNALKVSKAVPVKKQFRGGFRGGFKK